MAYCEKCGSKGHDPSTLVVDPIKRILLGPCCANGHEQRFNPEDINWGLEISSHYGVKAYVEYGGVSLQFRKTAEEVSRWMQGQEPDRQMNLPLQNPSQDPDSQMKN